MQRLMIVRSLMAVVAIAGMLAVSSLGATAQETAEEVALLIEVLNCESAEQLGAGPCEPAAGVEVSVETTDGEALGSCTTEAGTIQDMEVGFCYVDVPVGTVVVTEDVTTVPDGYAPVENPRTIEVRVPGPDTQDYIPVASFFNVPEASNQPDTGEETDSGETDEGTEEETTTGATSPPTTALPSTGTGTISNQPYGALGAAALIFAAIGSALGLRGLLTR